MLNYKKIDTDTHEVYINTDLVGWIICDRTSSIRGYRVVIKSELLGYGFNDYKKNLNDAKSAFERNYRKFLDYIGRPNVYYASEVDMYFLDYSGYERFKTTPVYYNRLERMKGRVR